jgi:hypothetical protein
MFIILEWNGVLPEGFMGAMLQENGEVENFATEEEAEIFAKGNCAFNYQIVEL